MPLGIIRKKTAAAQKTTGWKAILSMSGAYGLCQNLLGADDFYRRIIHDHIRPFPGMRILDLGCGPARILKFMPRDIYYAGLDPSPEYIKAARSRYGYRADFFRLSVEEFNPADLAGFDLVLGLGVLHHLDDAGARIFFSAASGAAHEKGRCLTADPCLLPGQNPLARLLMRLDRGGCIRSLESYSVLAAGVFSRVRQIILQDGLRLPYTHLLMECRK